jgi:hypothetical protein
MMNREFSQIYVVEHNQEQLWSEPFVDEALKLLFDTVVKLAQTNRTLRGEQRARQKTRRGR